MMEREEKLKSAVEELGITLSAEQIGQFLRYYELLIEWNGFMNLTGITEYEEVVQKHFVDSLTLVKILDLQKAESLIDIGTGAGFPGLPLKIAFPHLKVTLLDSLNKRIKFLDTVIQETGLHNIQTIHGRAEDFAKQKPYREQYDLAVSRAVANLASLSEYCLPYVKIGGSFVSYKSGKIEEELAASKKAIHVLGGKLGKRVDFHLPGSDISRSLIGIEKLAGTPKVYPRKAGLPTKEPIH